MQVPGYKSWTPGAVTKVNRRARFNAHVVRNSEKDTRHRSLDQAIWSDQSETAVNGLPSDKPLHRYREGHHDIFLLDRRAISHANLKRGSTDLGGPAGATSSGPAVTVVTQVTTEYTTVPFVPPTSTSSSTKSITSSSSSSSSESTSSARSTAAASKSSTTPSSTISPSHVSHNAGSIAGAVVGAIISLALLALLIALLARRHRRRVDERRVAAQAPISGPVGEPEKPDISAADLGPFPKSTTSVSRTVPPGFEQHVPPSHVPPGLRAEGLSAPESLETLPALTYQPPPPTSSKATRRQTYEPPRPESLTRDIVQMLDSAAASPRTTRSGSIIVRRDVRGPGWDGTALRSPRFQEIFGNGQFEYRAGSEEVKGVESPTLGYEQQQQQRRADDARRKDLVMAGYI